MGERLLRFILPTIPLLLIGVCVMAAFAAHDWDVQRTLFADDPMKRMEQILSPDAISNRETIELVNIDLSEGGDEITLDLMFHSPLNVPVTVTELAADIAIGDGVGTLRLSDEVNVPGRVRDDQHGRSARWGTFNGRGAVHLQPDDGTSDRWNNDRD